MRTTTLVLLSLFVLAAAAFAQSPIGAAPGHRVRIRLGDGRTLIGALVVAGGGEVTVQTGDSLATVRIPMIERFDVSTGRGFRLERAVKPFAFVGSFVLAYALADGARPKDAVRAALVVGAVGGLLAGGGRRAVRGTVIGAVLAAPVGAMIALSTYEECYGWCFLDFGPGGTAAIGAFLGATLGAGVGLIGGALLPGDRWEEVPTLGFAVRAGRPSVSLSVRF